MQNQQLRWIMISIINKYLISQDLGFFEKKQTFWYNNKWGCTGFDQEAKYKWHAEDSVGLLKKPRRHNCQNKTK